MGKTLDNTSRVKDIRAMAGKAFLDGPKEYFVAELEGPLLDLAVSKITGVSATIYLVDNAISPFYECCKITDGRFHYQYLPSRDWTQGGHIIEKFKIDLQFIKDNIWSAHQSGTDNFTYGETPLVAAMRSLVFNKYGSKVLL